MPQRGWIRLSSAGRDLGLQLLAGLVGVDRLVLGGVVLEDAAQVGQERDQREVDDEDRHPDQPFDDHEVRRCLDREPVVISAGRP